MELIDVIKEYEAEAKRYVNMSVEEFSSLPDEKLLEAAVARAEKKVYECEDMIEGISLLNEAQKILFCINCFDMEIQNGGLCQFFVNPSCVMAPFVSEYLEAIGANDHKKLFDDFVAQNQIDLTDLSSFEIDDVSEYESQTERYPFDDFDDAYCDLEPLENFLKAYVKKQITEF